ncbi:MAG: long-chain fatty acid--CoA ligase [Acidimicrobiales bacterium]
MLLSDTVAYNAIRHPDVPALIFSDCTYTYDQLASRVRRLANAILTIAEPGDRVAILSENRPEYVECYYGIPRAGMGLCFLNYRLNPREIARIINDAEPTVLVTEPDYVRTVEAIRAELPSVRHVIVAAGGAAGGDLDYDDLLSSVSDDEPVVEVSEDSLAWLIYTSGTTGTPKGASLSHRNLVAAVANSAMSWDRHERDTVLFPWPLCHVSGYVWPLSHLMGNTVVLMRAYDPEQFLTHIQRYRCTSATSAPTMLNMLLQHPRFEEYDLSSLRSVGYGAAAMPVEVLKRAMDKLPGVEFATGFGMTELAGNVFVFDAARHLAAMERNPSVLRSVGQQMPMAVSRVVDDNMNDVVIGDIGELVVKGPQVMTGYWKRPDANEEAFAGGWFHTGDLAKWDNEGNLYIVDRKKDMIITGGENVYSREVEDVLYAHPAVAEAAVVGVPDETWGENIVAVVQLRPGATVEPAELIALCLDNLASFKKPKQIVFVDELPKNAAGKILKRQLRDEMKART